MAPLSGRVDQVALIVPDLQATMDAYIETMGVAFQVFEVDETMSSYSGSSPEFRIRIAVAPVGLTTVELIQPVSGDTFYTRHLATHEPGLHHLGIYVDDLGDAKRDLTARGYTLVLDGSIRDVGEFAYFEAPDLHCVIESLHLSVGLPKFLLENASWYYGKNAA